MVTIIRIDYNSIALYECSSCKIKAWGLGGLTGNMDRIPSSLLLVVERTLFFATIDYVLFFILTIVTIIISNYWGSGPLLPSSHPFSVWATP